MHARVGHDVADTCGQRIFRTRGGERGGGLLLPRVVTTARVKKKFQCTPYSDLDGWNQSNLRRNTTQTFGANIGGGGERGGVGGGLIALVLVVVSGLDAKEANGPDEDEWK